MVKIKFGTDGWRGIIADDFTFSNLAVVTQAVANYLLNLNKPGQKIVVGYDNRFLSDKFAVGVSEVLAGNGIKVLLTDSATPTPVTAFMVKDTNADGAFMITASHNPYYYNGIKFIPEYAGPAHNGITAQIEKEMEKVETPRWLDFEQAKDRGLISYYRPKANYFAHLDQLIDKNLIKKSGLKLAVDYLYGAGMGYYESYLGNVLDLSVLHDKKDPLFNNLYPDPVEKNLNELRHKVIMAGAHLGIAFDGDADRFGIIDEKGTFYSPNQIASLLLPYLIETRQFKGPVYRTVATTHLLDKIAEKFDLPIVETPVGFKYLAEGFLKDNAIFGAEESGGMSIKGHIPEKDGILASLLVVEMLARRQKPLSRLWEENCQKYGRLYQERVDLTVTKESKGEIIKKVNDLGGNKIGSLEFKEIKNIDGKKFIFDEAWCLIRPSGTENVIRIYFEANEREILLKVKDDIIGWLT
ncbi:MAG: phosphoglucomutase/phosphomannomutase family protein [Clostridia bacterium]|nr:phosphoglucomutase/phosphomannomutase family protein [Clostridia bacterium]